MTAVIGSTVYTHYYKLVADDVTASVILITAIIIIIFWTLGRYIPEGV